MDLIYYRGLNCHLACLVNIADALGVNYTDAFASLWSETDFTDEIEYNIYVSKRVFINLGEIGIMTEKLDCRETKIEESFSRIDIGQFLLIGTDIYSIPWHPLFNFIHDRHYFFAQKETAHSLLCFDPIYDEKNFKLNPRAIFSSVFDLSRIHRLDVPPPSYIPASDAKEILLRHPETNEKLKTEILKCKEEGASRLSLLIKQINAMINNRYLFARFFLTSPFAIRQHKTLFNKAYFSKWEAIRNGLYKSTIVKDNKSVLDEASSLLERLMREEMEMAREIAATDSAGERREI